VTTQPFEHAISKNDSVFLSDVDFVMAFTAKGDAVSCLSFPNVLWVFLVMNVV
jgi:hypothetical protein